MKSISRFYCPNCGSLQIEYADGKRIKVICACCGASLLLSKDKETENVVIKMRPPAQY